MSDPVPAQQPLNRRPSRRELRDRLGFPENGVSRPPGCPAFLDVESIKGEPLDPLHIADLGPSPAPDTATSPTWC
ncbi:hypothetical protein [Micromonospora sp. WMMD736]|uniref:hypothetical protein n=1 Tax=Micromonospora sp. WMMD736 TaxID=3404112 RepID=UPI003B9259D0